MVPIQKGDIEIIEKLQKRATKLIIYSKRLRGDMREFFKIVHDFYHLEAAV